MSKQNFLKVYLNFYKDLASTLITEQTALSKFHRIVHKGTLKYFYFWLEVHILFAKTVYVTYSLSVYLGLSSFIVIQ